MLQTIAEDAGGCCKRSFFARLKAETLGTVFTCPTCGCEYRPKQEGPVVVWNYDTGMLRW